MAVYPTQGGSAGTWGTETSAFHAVTRDLATGKVKNEALQVADTAPIADAALANKKYVDDQNLIPLNGTPTAILTKFLTGTTDSDSQTDVAHGIASALTKLKSCVVMVSDGSEWKIADYISSSSGGFRPVVGVTNVSIKDVTAGLQNKPYSIKLEYIL